MKTLTLQHVTRSYLVTQGVLLRDDGTALCVTLEDPWKFNQPYMSCIPDGVYLCRLIQSNKYGVTYEVMDIHGRTHVLFHWGNWVKDTNGCILVGKYFGMHDEFGPAVYDSKNTFDNVFMKYLAGAEAFQLVVRGV